MTNNFRAIFAGIGVFNARLEENIGGMRVVQAFANEAHERALFARDNESYRRVKLRGLPADGREQRAQLPGDALDPGDRHGRRAWFVVHGALSSGDFVGFLLLVGVMFRPVDKISAVLEVYPKGLAGFRRYCELIDTAPDARRPPRCPPGAAAARRDRLSRASTFGYAPGRLVLRD